MSFLFGLVIGCIVTAAYFKMRGGSSSADLAAEIKSSASDLRANASQAIDSAVSSTSAAGAAAGQAASKIADKARSAAANAASHVAPDHDATITSLREEIAELKKKIEELQQR